MGTKIDLRDPKTRQRAGLGNDTVSARSRKKTETVLQQKRAVDETRRLIIDTIYDAHQPLTRLMICRLIERQKSPHLVALIEQLVIEGVIGRGCTIAANGVPTYWYCEPLS
jgi:hypothetical protein